MRARIEKKSAGATAPRSPSKGSALPVLLLTCVLAATPAAAQSQADPSLQVRPTPDGRGYQIDPATCPPRPPGPQRQEKIAQLAVSLWEAAGRHTISDVPGKQRGSPNATAVKDLERRIIAGLWSAVPTDSDSWTAALIEKWRVDPEGAAREHWSAAFTSWIMCQAGLSLAEFRRNPAHARYLSHARTDGRSAYSAGDFHNGPAARPGDLVCADMQGGLRRLSQLPVGQRRPLHCHVVVAVEPDAIRVIGGNVDGTIVETTIPRRADSPRGTAKLPGIPRSRWTWFAIMRLKEGIDH